MKIELKNIAVKDIIKNFQDNEENGVTGYDSKLNIRPPYQREFIYNDKQRHAVIETIMSGFPLNVMYWSSHKNQYELIDGQQRSISICQFATGHFAFNGKYFHNLTDDERTRFLNYKLQIYFCEGTDSEKLKWFETINIAGEKLTKQELRNAIYSGTFLNEAKKYFSKTHCAAYEIGKDYIKGSPLRQDYLETVLGWISNDCIEEYMAQHQHEEHCNELWLYFKKVIDWSTATFITYRKEMKGLDWGKFYNEYHDKTLNPHDIESQVHELMMDDEVTKKSGIYHYILSGNEKYLNLRTFTEAMKRAVYERQGGKCAISGEKIAYEECEADHITAWSKQGKTNIENCQMISKEENRKKSNK